MASPAAMVVTPSVFVIDRSPVGVIDVMSVATLSTGLGSLTPAGTSIRAVLTMTPVGAETVATTVNVADAPTPRSTVVLMLPVPDPTHVPPPVATQLQVLEASPVGSTSTTGAPKTAEGPALVATIV